MAIFASFVMERLKVLLICYCNHTLLVVHVSLHLSCSVAEITAAFDTPTLNSLISAQQHLKMKHTLQSSAQGSIVLPKLF